MKKNLLVIFSLTLALAGSSFSQPDGKELLDQLRSKFDAIKDLSAEFVQKLNGKTVQTGMLYYKKTNKLRINLKSLTIISDGKTSWNYNKKENKVIISNYDDTDPGVFSIDEIVYKFPSHCDISAKVVNGERILTLIPTSYTYNFSKIDLWLNDENLISKVLIVDSVSGKTEIIFSNYELNQNLSDSGFSFIPPEGSKIIDLR
jgi:chaperone LolA